MDKKYAVEVDSLEKKFGDFTAVNRLTFRVDRGEIFGFLGPNGAGKSTTIKMLCGILLPTSGEGHVGGFSITGEQEKIKENIGYMSQKFSLYENLTVEENINFYSGIYTIPRQERASRKEWVLELAGLKDLRNMRTAILAGGWKQRLALGCAIIHKPGIIFLDEPTSGVDPIARQNFWQIIKNMAKEGVTVFVTTHYMDEAENCERMALIYRGDIIAAGSPEELKTEAMKEKVVSIDIDEPEEWIDILKAIPGVRDAALFGSVLHANLENDGALEAIRTAAAGKGRLRSMRYVKPSLEDVFVSLIEEHDRKAGVG